MKVQAQTITQADIQWAVDEFYGEGHEPLTWCHTSAVAAAAALCGCGGNPYR